MSLVKQILFPLAVLFLFFSCKDKRHDKSKEYKIDSYAFNLVADVTFREKRLAGYMRKAIQEKKRIIINPVRSDTIYDNKKFIDDYDKGILDESLDSMLIKSIDQPDNFSKEESKYLQEKRTDLAIVFRHIQTTYRAFDSYYRTNSYNQDKGKKGFTLLDSIHRLDVDFTTISDSLILKSSAIYRDIYLLKNTRPSAKCILAMGRTIKISNNFNRLLDSVILGTKPYNNATQKDIDRLTDSISKMAFSGPATTLSSLTRSKLFWEYPLYARFRDLQSTMALYISRFQKYRATKEDLDYLKDIEQRMRHDCTLYTKL